MSKLNTILGVACGAALWLTATPVFGQANFYPTRPNYIPPPPTPPALGITGSGPLFLLGPRYEAQRRSQANQFRSAIGQLQQTQSLLQQQLSNAQEDDIDQYLLNNNTLLGRRAATFDDTRGAFPGLEVPRKRALGPRSVGGRR